MSLLLTVSALARPSVGAQIKPSGYYAHETLEEVAKTVLDADNFLSKTSINDVTVVMVIAVVIFMIAKGKDPKHWGVVLTFWLLDLLLVHTGFLYKLPFLASTSAAFKAKAGFVFVFANGFYPLVSYTYLTFKQGKLVDQPVRASIMALQYATVPVLFNDAAHFWMVGLDHAYAWDHLATLAWTISLAMTYSYSNAPSKSSQKAVALAGVAM